MASMKFWHPTQFSVSQKLPWTTNTMTNMTTQTRRDDKMWTGDGLESPNIISLKNCRHDAATRKTNFPTLPLYWSCHHCRDKNILKYFSYTGIPGMNFSMSMAALMSGIWLGLNMRYECIHLLHAAQMHVPCVTQWTDTHAFYEYIEIQLYMHKMIFFVFVYV